MTSVPSTDGVRIASAGVVEVVPLRLRSLEAGEALVRVRYSLLSSGTDKTCFLGDFDTPSHWSRWVKYPFAPGYSAVGDVVEVGPDVTRLAVGDRVVVRRPHQGLVIASEQSSYVVPPEVKDEDAVWFALSAIAQHGVRRAGQELGTSAAVVGMGPLGQLVGQYARAGGAGEVFAIAANQNRLARASANRLTPVAGRASDAEQTMLDLTDGAGVDIVYDVTGSSEVLSQVAKYTRPKGKVVLIGDTPTPAAQVMGGEVLRRELSVIGVHDSGIVRSSEATPDSRWTFDKNVELFFGLLRDRRISVDGLVTHRFAASDAQRAFATIADSSSGSIGVLLDWREKTSQGERFN